jgi:predicted metal-dependent hydrolase
VQLELPFLRVADTSADAQSPRPAEGRPGPAREKARDTIEFVRMRRARRYILRVRPDGSLRVTVPRGGSRREAEAFVTQNAKWIERERRRVRAEHAPVEWHAGSEILFRGIMVRIAVFPRCAGGSVISYGDRRIALERLDNLRAAIERDLCELATRELIPRLHELGARHGIRLGRVTIRNQRSRWGSCARNGNIALNFRLVQMPDGVRDYVLLHELMHIRQQNHSRRFWKLVASVCPDFRESERWLRTVGRSLF